ncbi:MAG TPA: hypothetical protein VG347_10780 [Verrucomicrobiae bacterium]|nr:hypothetical protein [Verrucomicrobiae bacterium]
MNTSPTTNKNVAPNLPSQPLSQETIRSLQELGEVYRQIHRRLVSEGYIIRDGKIFKPGVNDKNDGANG